jgi:crotonobetainyl-CoA:carnitine CoA-transferase CaiB-like acyl-CoA transferase
MGKPELADDPRFALGAARTENQEDLERIIEDWTLTQPKDALYRLLVDGGVPAAPIYTVADAFADPQYAAREMIAEVPDDELGTVKLANIVPKLLRNPGKIRWSGRAAGHDTRAVLSDYLGLSATEIETLEAAGAIVSAEETTE